MNEYFCSAESILKLLRLVRDMKYEFAHSTFFQTYVVQESERGLRGGVLASLAAELSDSEGGYSTILDAIPHEHVREPCPPVPVR